MEFYECFVQGISVCMRVSVRFCRTCKSWFCITQRVQVISANSVRIMMRKIEIHFILRMELVSSLFKWKCPGTALRIIKMKFQIQQLEIQFGGFINWWVRERILSDFFFWKKKKSIRKWMINLLALRAQTDDMINDTQVSIQIVSIFSVRRNKGEKNIESDWSVTLKQNWWGCWTVIPSTAVFD